MPTEKEDAGKKEPSQIVKSKSKAYSYNYASLADIVKQGYKLPKMVTRIVDGQLFVYWFDEERQDWLQGAPVVIPEMRGMNQAQAMGSALTYARRYTAQMALGLACDDDAKIEKTASVQSDGKGGAVRKRVDFVQVREHLQTITDSATLTAYWKGLNLSEKQANVLKEDFAKRKAELGGENG